MPFKITIVGSALSSFNADAPYKYVPTRKVHSDPEASTGGIRPERKLLSIIN
ncbi:MAG: hypothetical protein ABI172_07475 [Ginsengibacter sp.]